MQVDVKTAELNLTQLMDKALSGEDVIITNKNASFQLVPKKEKPVYSSFPFGRIPGIIIKDNFDDPLPKEIAASFGITEDMGEIAS